MTEGQIKALLEALKAGLEGDIVDKITITIKPKKKPASK